MLPAFILSIDEDVIEIHHNKNNTLLYQDLIDVALECGRCVSQSKRYHLVLEIAIEGPEDRLSFISFPNPHLMVGISQIELGKMSSLT